MQTSHFFACLDRLKLIQRWSLMRNIETENLAEHSLQVAFVAHALALIKNTFYQGQVNPEITQAYKEIERSAELHLISLLPLELQQEFTPYLDSSVFSAEEKHIVKQADLLCAYIKAKFELEQGNQEFSQAKVRLEKLMQDWHSPEMEYFMQVFVPSFGRSIDEIALQISWL